MLVQLVKAVNAKIRGYCRGETVAHYRSIVSRAWEQVEAASTPAIKSRPFDEDLEWMMMDDGFERRARRILAKGPVLMPAWWDDYRPWAPVVHDARSATSTPTQGRGRSPAARGARGEGGQIALPTLPGAAFASTLVGGIERSAGGVVDRPESLTAEVGDRTGRLVGLRRGRVERLPDRPRPRTRPASKGSRSEAPSFPSSSDAGSSSCPCACACAGCACACAGGGR